jgi:hypothetical protein
MAASISKVPKRVPRVSVVLVAVGGLYGESRLSFVSLRLGVQGVEPGMVASPHRPESRADRPGRTQHRPRVAAIASHKYGGPAARPCAWPPRRRRCRGRESAEELAGSRRRFHVRCCWRTDRSVLVDSRVHLDVCGLRSRCTIRCSCAASSASAICVRWGTSSIGIGLCAIRSASRDYARTAVNQQDK